MGMENRISKNQHYLNIAKQVAQRSTCLRRKYGAVLVNNDVIVSTGYNGSARGETNCCDTGHCWRVENNIPSGERYEACKSVHAEQNAIINANRADCLNATLYLWGEEANGAPIYNPTPCLICERMLHNAGIYQIINLGYIEDLK